MVSALDRKLLRDLANLRGQVVTIALVVACGIASYVTLQSAWSSLERSKVTYYVQYRFGDVFAHLQRAPESVRSQLHMIPGVANVYTRVVERVTLPLDGRAGPPVAEIVSVPANGEAPLGRLYMQAGRPVEPGRADEAVLLTKFAERYGFTVGDTLPIIINGERRLVRIVGLATSPEYVYPMPRGGSAGIDDERFAVLWMDRRAMAPAFQMEGAFNDVVIRLQPGASEAAVLREVDRVLDRYGGFSAVGRSRQPSNDILHEEMTQLRTWATVVPLIFLGVSAFLLNVVLARLVQLQRPELATLKALGYSDWVIGAHYLKMVTTIVLLGAVVGIGIGIWLGQGLTALYADVFRFPFFAYRLDGRIPVIATLLSFTAGAAGAVGTVRRIMLLPPAEAMRPPAPGRYRPLLVERLGLAHLISPAGRMVVRELERRPLRTTLSILGIAAGLATLVVGRFAGDAFDYLLDVQFSRVMRETLSVTFRHPVAERAVREFAHLPGVWRAEGIRVVPVRLEAGHRYREVAVFGYPAGMELRQIVSRITERPVSLPADGLMLTQTLGEVLGIQAGDSVLVKVLEGERGTYRIRVSRLVDELVGMQGYMPLPALSRVIGEDPAVSIALLGVDGGASDDVIRRLNQKPTILSITRRSTLMARLREQSGASMAVVSLVLTLFAITIAVSVVYNNARIALSLRGRDLASLRVLGFSRAEVSRILLGELALQVLIAIPVGLALGTWLTSLVIGTVHPERYRFPVVLSMRTYVFAAVVVLLSSAASSLLVRRRLDRLDLIGVLKVRE